MSDYPLQPSGLSLITERRLGDRYKTIVGVRTPLGYEGGVRLGNWEEITEGVSFQTVTPLQEEEPIIEDGAWVVLKPGSATPPQLVKEGVYSENPILFNGAKVYCLLVSPENELFIFCFATSLSGMSVVAAEGWVMSIVSPITNYHQALIAEWETPMWTEKSLEIIEEDSDFGRSLPSEFWQRRKELMKGVEGDYDITMVEGGW